MNSINSAQIRDGSVKMEDLSPDIQERLNGIPIINPVAARVPNTRFNSPLSDTYGVGSNAFSYWIADPLLVTETQNIVDKAKIGDRILIHRYSDYGSNPSLPTGYRIFECVGPKTWKDTGISCPDGTLFRVTTRPNAYLVLLGDAYLINSPSSSLSKILDVMDHRLKSLLTPVLRVVEVAHLIDANEAEIPDLGLGVQLYLENYCPGTDVALFIDGKMIPPAKFTVDKTNDIYVFIPKEMYDGATSVVLNYLDYYV